MLEPEATADIRTMTYSASLDAINTQLQQLTTNPAAMQAYAAVLRQLLQQITQHAMPAIIAISGAQGTGKTTLAKLLITCLETAGLAAAAVSLDDYYFSRAKRISLSQTVHPLMAQRGVPGTHNIQQAIADAKAVLAGTAVTLPQFDKALNEPAEPLPAKQLDILIVEGWCLGLPAQTEQELIRPVNALEAEEDQDGRWRRFVNQQLATDYAEYWQLMSRLIWLCAPSWHAVCRWRAKQEHRLWQERGTGMSEQTLTRFMLLFQRLTQHSWQSLPGRATDIILLDEQQVSISPNNDTHRDAQQ